MIPVREESNKWMQLPRDIVIGHGAINDIQNVCDDLKLRDKPLIVTGMHTKNVAGKMVYDIFDDASLNPDIIATSEASLKAVECVKTRAINNNTNYLLGVGSGKSIDVAKLAATQLDVPFISVPTAASHDGIVSSRTSIHDGNKVSSIESNAPMAVVADTQIIANAPYRLLAAGCGDIISNYSAVNDWELAYRLRNESFSEYAATLSRMTAKIILDSADAIKPGLESSVRIVVKALVSSGVAMSIAGSSRPASGSEHMFSHALDIVAPKHALHGEQCGIGAIMMMYLHGGDWNRIRNGLKKLNAPTSASEMGIEDKYILEALLLAHTIRPERYTILGSGLNQEAAEKVAKITKVIE